MSWEMKIARVPHSQGGGVCRGAVLAPAVGQSASCPRCGTHSNQGAPGLTQLKADQNLYFILFLKLSVWSWPRSQLSLGERGPVW